MPYPEDNLKKKGAEANPNGRPLFWQTASELYKKYSLMSREELQQVDLNSLPAKDVMIINDVIRAVGGKDASINRFQDRTDGKPVQRIEQTYNPQEEIQRIQKLIEEQNE